MKNPADKLVNAIFGAGTAERLNAKIEAVPVPPGPLSRIVKIVLFANGAMDYTLGPNLPKGSLPVFSVDTIEEAEGLQVSLCRLSREDGRTYYLPFPQTSDEGNLRHVTQMLTEFYDLQKQGIRGASLWEPMTAYKNKFGLL